MRTLLCFTALLLFTLACGKSPAPEASVRHFKVTGLVMRIDPLAKTATIRHETILDEKGKVWMEAMTMDFPVRDAREFEKLKPDQHIEARVNQKPDDFDFWIDQITPR